MMTHYRKWVLIAASSLLFLWVGLLSSCINESEKGRKAIYVKPSVDKRGRFRKGHIRMPVSTKKDAIQNQNRSRYYYQTRGKYRRKKRRD